MKLLDNTPTLERVTVFHIAVDSRLGHRQRRRYSKVFLDDLHDRLKWGNHDVIGGGPFIATCIVTVGQRLSPLIHGNSSSVFAEILIVLLRMVELGRDLCFFPAIFSSGDMCIYSNFK